ncbi:DUF6461 domain-containing protein [Spirillospora sp. CA-294931]|uniref:DUF6461 domain-containing protein n=1 Tax=Spirillospora sp. CA-294931 TaxID=3240042 RepID=UPI003D90EB5D
MTKVSLDDLAWASAVPDDDRTLAEVFCLTFVKGVGEREALLRLGAQEGTFGRRTLSEVVEEMESYDAGYPDVAASLNLGEWTVLIEPDGFNGAHLPLLAALSRGTEAVSALRHDYASDHFGYAVDGTLVTSFDPIAPQYRHGADPDRLLALMRDAGFRPEPGESHEDDETEMADRAATRALYVAGRITGVVPALDALRGTFLSAHVEPWFSEAAEPPDTGVDDGLAAAFLAASPQRRRRVAVAETERLAALLGLAHAPGLTEALAEVREGRPVRVPGGSPLGRTVRSLLTESRRAGVSLNDPGTRDRMTEEERTLAFQGGWFAQALRAVLAGEPGPGVFRPLCRGPRPLKAPEHREVVLQDLRGA